MKNTIKYLIFFSIFVSQFWFLHAADRDLPSIDIISRKERWADEEMRLESNERFQSILQYRENYQKEMQELKESDFDAYYKKYQEEQEASYKSQMANDYLKENYLEEIDLDWTNYENQWDELRWPEYHHDDKNKILIHHTASDNSILKSKSDVKNYLSWVYRYHTIKHGRWDIWYNFLIDPFWNIYEGRAWWEWVVWAHAKRNNTPSVWISLMWNFDIQYPTNEAVDSLINLSTAIAKKYKINPESRVDYHRDSKNAPYILSEEDYAIAWHRDAGITSCPGENLYNLLPYIRDEVEKWLDSKTLTSNSSSNSTTSKTKTKLTYEYFESIQTKISWAIRSIKNQYLKENNILVWNKESMQKLKWNIDLAQAKIYLQQDISVLLYELTQEYDRYDLSCDGWCIFVFDQNRIEWNEWYLEIWSDIHLEVWGQEYNTSRLIVYSKNDLITVNNYNRDSYAGIPRNTFHGWLVFKKDFIKDLDWKQENKFVVINKLPFSQYMEWIVETNDTESDTKNKVMALISKSYALFYMNPKNVHPNIPIQATYNAVDDSRIFQKYVWAWLEKTLTKRYRALNNTEDKIITYNNQVVVLPYFSCSAGFTYSAKEKRWWTDTPYLKSRFDLWICKDKDFSWHWVWLSWLWAERRSKFGRSYQDILNYYYPGIEIKSI